MRVLQFEPRRYSLSKPIVTAMGTITSRSGFSVRLGAEEREGRGEVLPLPGWSTVSVAMAGATLAGLARTSDPWAAAQQAPREVRSAVDCAHWSLRAELEGTTLAGVLGAGEEVRVNALIDGVALDRLDDVVAQALADGYTTLKVKLGFVDDAERIRVLDRVVPDHVAIRLDPNCAWASHEAEHFAILAGELGARLDYIEDPVADLAALKALRAHSSVPIAADALASVENLPRLFREGLVDTVVVKPALLGGITPVLELATVADRHGVDLVVSSTYDGPDALRCWCLLAAAVAPSLAHGLGTAALIDHPAMAPLVPEAGRIDLMARDFAQSW